MNTLALKKERKTFGPKQILLTLMKGPGDCHMTARIAPIGKNLEVKITDRKLIEINTENGHNMFSKEMHNLQRFYTDNQLQRKITPVPITKRQNSLNMKEGSILDNALASKSKFYDKFTKILFDRQKADDSNNKAPFAPSSLNRQDRFVPNILRSTKMAENTSNNNNIIRLDLRNTANNYGTDKHCKDDRNVKRKRKQVLSSSNVECDWIQKAHILGGKKNKHKKSLLRIHNLNSARETRTKTLKITGINSEQKDDNKRPEIAPESLASREELTVTSSDPEDLYAANIEILHPTENLPSTRETDINCNYDKSIKKIFAEFEVADYQSYIDCDDLGFNIDEMDKLLSSDIESSLTDSLILEHSTELVEYDVNGNDIDNHGHLPKKSNKRKKFTCSEIRCNMEPCHDDEADKNINASRRLECDINLDDICSAAWNDGRSYETSELNLWSNKFEDCHSNDYFQSFHCSPGGDSSSTDTASESETNDLNSTQTSSVILPEHKNLECFATSLVVSDMVPDNVFSDCSNELCSDGLESDDTVKRSSASSPMMQQYHLNSGNSSDDNCCISLSSLPLERLASSFQLDDSFDENLEICQDGDILIDDLLNMNCAVSLEDETCEAILANSNAKFDNEHRSSIHEDFPDLDIENVDDIVISQLLISRKNRFTSVSDATPQPQANNAPENESSMDIVNQSNTNHSFMVNHDDSQIGIMKFENPLQVRRESNLNKSICSEGAKFSFNNEVESGLQECKAGDEDLGHLDSTSANLPLQSNESLLLHDGNAKAKDMDGKTSGSQCSSLYPIEKKCTSELKVSKLESLLTRMQACASDQSAHCHLKTTNTEHCSQVEGHSDVDIFYSTQSSDKSFYSPTTSDKNLGDISYSYAAREKNTITEGTVVVMDDDYGVANRGIHQPLESELAHNRDSSECQSISYSVPIKKPASSGELSVNLKKPRGGLWRDLIKRSKFVTQNISNIPCDFCENKYRSEAALADHIRITHRHRPSRLRYRNKKYVCDKCSKEYMFAGAIEKHFQLHDDYTLTCRICEKHFSERIFLRRHVYGSHFNWTFQCDYCSRKFSRRNALSRHVKKCHGPDNFH